MVRTAFADEHLLSYFHSLSKQNTYSIGLILGQSVSGKDYVIHFAKTPPFVPPEAKEEPALVPRLTSLNDVNEDWVGEHARQATRMLPGGMHVLGVFIVALEDLLNPFSSKLKSILNKIHQTLDNNRYLFGNPDTNEKLVLNYCLHTQQYSCKSYDVIAGNVKPAEFKFVPNSSKWAKIECEYQMDQVYNIKENENDWPLKKHIGIILDKMNEGLESSVFLYDGELKDEDESIENIGKKKRMQRSNKSSGHEENLKPLHVSILQPCEAKDKVFSIKDAGNQIRIFGHVVCKLWLNPKVSVKAASGAILEDIMRSLSTRLEMHWDSLTEEEHGEDMNSVHEPPRRVLIPLPNSKITISDYLFPGEGPQDAKNSLEETLDIKIVNEADVVDVEGQADLTDYYNEALDSESEEIILKKPMEGKKSLYFIGIAVALLVLIISLVIHFIQQN